MNAPRREARAEVARDRRSVLRGAAVAGLAPAVLAATATRTLAQAGGGAGGAAGQVPPPRLVGSTEGDPRFTEVEETCLFQLRFPSGAVASLSSSYGHADVKRIQVMGEQASLELDPATDYYKHNLWVRTKQEERKVQVEDGNQFALQMDHMAGCVLEGKEPRTPGEEGLRDVRIMAAIYESAREGRAVRL